MKLLRKFIKFSAKLYNYGDFTFKFLQSSYTSVSVLTPKKCFKTSVIRHKIKSFVLEKIRNSLKIPVFLQIRIKKPPLESSINDMLYKINKNCF